MKYKDHFDRLGNRIDTMTFKDELLCAVCIVILAILVSGVLV